MYWFVNVWLSRNSAFLHHISFFDEIIFWTFVYLIFFLLGSKSPGHMVILDQTKGDHCRPSRRGRYEKVSLLFPKEDNSVSL